MKNQNKQYFETALWSSIGNDDEPLEENYSLEDLSDEIILKSEIEIDLFIEKAGSLLNGLELSTVLHNFWLTRNHHGAGFWDGDYQKEVGEKLTKLSHDFGEVYLYVGDDGRLYL